MVSTHQVSSRWTGEILPRPCICWRDGNHLVPVRQWIGQGGTGTDPAIPLCSECGAYGGGGHGGGCSEPPPSCPCGHGPDDCCVNGTIYGPCEQADCGGGCEDAGACAAPPGCCSLR